jgi:WbqC-like protein
MRVAICQPTYLPWLGYFDLMDQVDAFVLLDTVQFEKQSWQQRNRIKTPTGLQWLTVPVVFRGRLGQQIREVEIRDPEFTRKHLRAIQLNYARSPYATKYLPELSAVLGGVQQNRSLADLNLRLIQWLVRTLGIETPLILASSLDQPGKRTELLANICRRLGASEYFSPLGSADYLLDEMQCLSSAGVATFFHHYEHPTYQQPFPPFLAFASALDLILNEGDRALKIVRSGRRLALLPSQVTERMAAS